MDEIYKTHKEKEVNDSLYKAQESFRYALEKLVFVLLEQSF